MQDFQTIDHEDGDPCPVHNTPHRKIYTFGSTMSADTDVCTFRGCDCAVSIKHDPLGFYPPAIAYHTSYDHAAGRGRLHAMQAAVKYS